jgi:hypothetical protein
MGLQQKLDHLEARLQILIEGGVARIFPDYHLEDELAPRLVDSLLASSKQNSEGQWIAPNLFTIAVHPGRAAVFNRQTDLFAELTRTLQSTGDESGLQFPSPPVIRITEDNTIALNQFRVQAQISLDNLARTTDILVDVDPDSLNLPPNSYLIVDGTRILPLTQAVINIGRRPDNQIAIEDPRVSRLHAQLRAIKGRFVIFDLDSTGGTYVNSQRVNQCALYQGDVISLAGYPLVYGQETAGIGETQRYSPSQES